MSTCRRAHAVDRDLDAVDGGRQHHAVRQEEGQLPGLPPAAGRSGGHPLRPLHRQGALDTTWPARLPELAYPYMIAGVFVPACAQKSAKDRALPSAVIVRC